MKVRRRPPNPSIKVANLEYAIPHEESEPRNILEKIVWEKETEIEVARNATSLETLKSQIKKLPKTLDFIQALRNAKKLPAVIAEVKKASPSKGVIKKDFDPTDIAKSYVKGGASCLSVLTDKTFFQGGFEVLSAVRKNVKIPILCKDFILSPYQIYQARASGADAILLIASILSDQDLRYLSKVATNLGLSFLVEVHDSEEFQRVVNIGVFPLIGINNRDLGSFETDLCVTEILAQKYSSYLKENNCLLVSESGLFTRSDLDRVLNVGAQAVLVGESLMRQDDIVVGLKTLIDD